MTVGYVERVGEVKRKLKHKQVREIISLIRDIQRADQDGLIKTLQIDPLRIAIRIIWRNCEE